MNSRLPIGTRAAVAAMELNKRPTLKPSLAVWGEEPQPPCVSNAPVNNTTSIDAMPGPPSGLYCGPRQPIVVEQYDPAETPFGPGLPDQRPLYLRPGAPAGKTTCERIEQRYDRDLAKRQQLLTEPMSDALADQTWKKPTTTLLPFSSNQQLGFIPPPGNPAFGTFESLPQGGIPVQQTFAAAQALAQVANATYRPKSDRVSNRAFINTVPVSTIQPFINRVDDTRMLPSVQKKPLTTPIAHDFNGPIVLDTVLADLATQLHTEAPIPSSAIRKIKTTRPSHGPVADSVQPDIMSYLVPDNTIVPMKSTPLLANMPTISEQSNAILNELLPAPPIRNINAPISYAPIAQKENTNAAPLDPAFAATRIQNASLAAPIPAYFGETNVVHTLDPVWMQSSDRAAITSEIDRSDMQEVAGTLQPAYTLKKQPVAQMFEPSAEHKELQAALDSMYIQKPSMQTVQNVQNVQPSQMDVEAWVPTNMQTMKTVRSVDPAALSEEDEQQMWMPQFMEKNNQPQHPIPFQEQFQEQFQDGGDMLVPNIAVTGKHTGKNPVRLEHQLDEGVEQTARLLSTMMNKQVLPVQRRVEGQVEMADQPSLQTRHIDPLLNLFGGKSGFQNQEQRVVATDENQTWNGKQFNKHSDNAEKVIPSFERMFAPNDQVFGDAFVTVRNEQDVKQVQTLRRPREKLFQTMQDLDRMEDETNRQSQYGTVARDPVQLDRKRLTHHKNLIAQSKSDGIVDVKHSKWSAPLAHPSGQLHDLMKSSIQKESNPMISIADFSDTDLSDTAFQF